MASKFATMDEEDADRSLINSVIHTIRKPFDIASSKTAQRAYLTTFLVISTAFILLGFAIAAYILFYWSYIPQIGFERNIHLQFDNVYHNSDTRYDVAANPYGTVRLSPDIVSQQRYDVSIELSLPRTPDNRDAGNFMLEASMFAPKSVLDPVKDSLEPGLAEGDNRLAFSRRSAILTYRSPTLEQLYGLSELHWYLLGWRREAEKLTITMFEAVEFPRGWRNVPATMKLVIQSTNRMQIYSAKAMFRARFGGLRWLMYNHRIISAVIFISCFWVTEILSAGAAWVVLSLYLTPPQDPKPATAHENGDKIKDEDDEDDEKPVLSDTERTFPSSSRQQPVRYESPRIKQEDEDDAVVLQESSNKATEADDEDEDADTFIDSGLGTSLESSSSRRDSVRRRRGRAGFDDATK